MPKKPSQLNDPNALADMDRVGSQTLSKIAEKELIKAFKENITEPIHSLSEQMVERGFNVEVNLGQHINEDIYSVTATIKVTPKSNQQRTDEAQAKLARSKRNAS